MANKKVENKTTKSKKAVSKTNNKSTSAKKTKTTKKKINLITLMQEENNYAKTIIAALIIVVIFLSGYFILKNNNKSPFESLTATADEKEFKKEYESINGTTRTNGQEVKKINIRDKNKMEYIDIEKALEILDNGSGVIYFGYAADPLCRNAVPSIIEAATDANLDKIYYINVRPNDKIENDIRDTYELNERNKPKLVKEGSDGYKDLIVALANELSDYVLYTDKGKSVNAGEKRLNVPTVVAIKDGELVGYHEGTVKGNNEEDGKVNDLTEAEEKELYNTYKEIFEEYLK